MQIKNIASVGGGSHQYFFLTKNQQHITQRAILSSLENNCFVRGGMGSVETFSQL